MATCFMIVRHINVALGIKSILPLLKCDTRQEGAFQGRISPRDILRAAEEAIPVKFLPQIPR